MHAENYVSEVSSGEGAHWGYGVWSVKQEWIDKDLPEGFVEISLHRYDDRLRHVHLEIRLDSEAWDELVRHLLQYGDLVDIRVPIFRVK